MASDSTSQGAIETLIRFWGVRGSIPTPGPSTARYGGNTSCVEFRINGELIVIDAGSGIRGLGTALIGEAAGQPITLTLLNTHTHWDHIQGFPFFAPAFMKGNRIRVIGRDSAPDGLQGVFDKLMDGRRCFPVPLGALGSDLSFEHIDEKGALDFQIGSIPVQAMPTNHPGGCLAYKFLTPQGNVVFLSDHETGGTDEPLVQEFIRDAVLLIADAQYSDEEIVSRRGWGHGCIKEVVDLACRAGVKQLRLFHHDPSHGDDALDQLLVEAQDLVHKANSSMNVAFVREGETILLS